MRKLKFIFYTLFALAAQELSHEANATPGFKLSTKKPEASNLVTANNTPTPAPTASIAPPETLEVQKNIAEEQGSRGDGELGAPSGDKGQMGKWGDSRFASEGLSKAASVAGQPKIQNGIQSPLLPIEENRDLMQSARVLVGTKEVGLLASSAVDTSSPEAFSPESGVKKSFELSGLYEATSQSDKRHQTPDSGVQQNPHTEIVDAEPGEVLVGQNAASASPTPSTPSLEDIQRLQSQLESVQQTPEFGDVYKGSPALTIVTPTGFGADNNTGFISATYQARTRFTDVDDGALGIGIGLGNARTVGVELSYAIASFGGSRNFGTGGFNLKVHRQFAEDLAVAVGWNGFINTGDNDFENSVYGVATKIFRTRNDINLPFSRMAVSAGLGSGQFRSEGDFDDDKDSVNVFGSVAVRVVRPVSFIAEWTGQDLGLGLSIVPFKNLGLVITPAVRDITGAGDGARFVLGTGISFKF